MAKDHYKTGGSGGINQEEPTIPRSEMTKPDQEWMLQMESQVIDLHNHGKATKEHLGEMDGKFLIMQTMLEKQMGMMEQLMVTSGRKEMTAPTAISIQPWGYDMKAPPLERRIL